MSNKRVREELVISKEKNEVRKCFVKEIQIIRNYTDHSLYRWGDKEGIEVP